MLCLLSITVWLSHRVIAFDNGYFQPIHAFNDTSKKATDIRKNCERPYNLMKKREGLEQTRVRSLHGVVARSTGCYTTKNLSNFGVGELIKKTKGF